MPEQGQVDNSGLVNKALTMPEFHALPVGARRLIMTDLSPDFAQLSAEDQDTFFDKAAQRFVPPPPALQAPPAEQPNPTTQQLASSALARTGLPPAARPGALPKPVHPEGDNRITGAAVGLLSVVPSQEWLPTSAPPPTPNLSPPGASAAAQPSPAAPERPFEWQGPLSPAQLGQAGREMVPPSGMPIVPPAALPSDLADSSNRKGERLASTLFNAREISPSRMNTELENTLGGPDSGDVIKRVQSLAKSASHSYVDYIPDATSPGDAVAKGIARAAMGAVSPENLAIILASGFAGEALTAAVNAPKVAALLRNAPRVAPALDIAASAAVPGAFGAKAAGDTAVAAKQGYEAYQQGNPTQAAGKGAEALTDLLFAVLGGHGAVKAGTGAAAAYPTAEQRGMREVPLRERPESSPVAQALEAARPEGVESNQPRPAQPVTPPAQATAQAKELRTVNKNLAAVAWDDLASGNMTGRRIPVDVGSRRMFLEEKGPGGPDGRPVVTVYDSGTGKPIYTGYAGEVRSYLEQMGAERVAAEAPPEPNAAVAQARAQHEQMREAQEQGHADLVAEVRHQKSQDSALKALDDIGKLSDQGVANLTASASPEIQSRAKAEYQRRAEQRATDAMAQTQIESVSEAIPRWTATLSNPLTPSGARDEAVRFIGEAHEALARTAGFQLSEEPAKALQEAQKQIVGLLEQAAKPQEKQKEVEVPQQVPQLSENIGQLKPIADAKVDGIADDTGFSTENSSGETPVVETQADSRYANDENPEALLSAATDELRGIRRAQRDAKVRLDQVGKTPQKAKLAKQLKAESERLAQDYENKAAEVTDAFGQDIADKTRAETPELHKFASTQVNLPADLGQRLVAEGAKIADEHLAEDGRETEPHITVKYGLHDDSPDTIAKLTEMLRAHPPARVKLGKTSLFTGGDADVVKVDVNSPDLHAINRLIADAFPHTDTHPDYHPHATVAYVKPGEGKQYAGNTALEGAEGTFSEIVLSGMDRRKHVIPLGGAPLAPAAQTDIVEAGNEPSSEAPASSRRGPPAARRRSAPAEGSVQAESSGRGQVRAGGGAGDQGRIESGPGARAGESEPGTATRGRHASGSERAHALLKNDNDFVILDEHGVGKGSLREKAKDNIEALRTLKAIVSENRPATDAEKQKLVKYVGWGGLSHAFDAHRSPVSDRAHWSGLEADLRSILTPEEFSAARASTPNAHYTSPDVIKAIWSGIERLGLKPGSTILEPSMGVGHFFGLMPESLRPAARTGIELDKATAAISKALYPDAAVHSAGFEAVRLPEDYFDLVVSNIPFGNYPVHDKSFKKDKFLTRSIHNYFVAKALNVTRPGGVVAIVTSHYTMDSQDAGVRRWIAERANLLGAIRLPETAFKENAATEVITDILFFQKRAPDAPFVVPDWIEAKTFKAANGRDDIGVNPYFDAHPEMVIGTVGERSGRFGPEINVTGQVTPEALTERMEKLPANVITDMLARQPQTPMAAFPEAGEMKPGGYGVVSGRLVQSVGGFAQPVDAPKETADRMKGLISLRGAVRDVFRTQIQEAGDIAIKAARKDLNAEYDSFEKKFGKVNTRANVKAFREDPDWPLLQALEEPETGAKAKVFTERTIHEQEFSEHVDETPQALAIVLAETGRVDWARLAELTGKSAQELQGDLSGIVFQNPNGRRWETADKYLSGNVRQKLKDAEEAARADPAFKSNVEALKAAQPKDLTPGEIVARLGAPWIPREDIANFVNEIIGARTARVSYLSFSATWKIEGAPHTVAATKTWGTDRAPASVLIEESLNARVARVMDWDSKADKYVVNEKETAAAQDKQNKLKEKFETWIWANAERADRLAKSYNEQMNALAAPSFDGSHLQLPGSSPSIKLRPHQKNAVWRSIQSDSSLFAHAVGAGKTYAMAATAMEWRRLGIARKPMLTVPNSRIAATAKEFRDLYPAAQLYVIDGADLAGQKRAQAMSRIATGNYDAVIVGHSSFVRLPLSSETKEQFFEEQLREIVDALEEARVSEGKQSFTVKELEKQKKRIETKLKNLQERRTQDNTVNFEDLGVDGLIVDEAQVYKNLFYVTKMTRVAGMGNPEGSGQAFDMFMKLRHLRSRRGRVVFATGTPIANTLLEMYHMMRYLAPEYLKENRIEALDAWVGSFAEAVPALELNPSGSGYRMNTRMRNFINAPELSVAFRQFADLQTADMLKLPVPKLKGGKVQAIVSKASPLQMEIRDKLIKLAESIKGKRPEKGAPNMLSVTTMGRKAALDVRVYNPGLPEQPNSKVHLAADKVHQIWAAGHDLKVTQAVFIDFSSPTSDTGFSLYHDLKKKLVERGIPEKEIAFVHEYDQSKERKAKLFRDVDDGEIRVVMGSTEKMGIGVNMQTHMKALHHMDSPWRPDQVTQREGRILRQGNLNDEVEVYQYLTEPSFDAYMWQALLNKAKTIDQIMQPEVTVRKVEDVSAIVLSAEEFIAASSGSPEVREKMGLEIELRKLNTLRAAHRDEQLRTARDISSTESHIESMKKRLGHAKKDAETFASGAQAFTIGKKTFTGDDARKQAAEALEAAIRKNTEDADKWVDVGSYRGFRILARRRGGSESIDINLQGQLTYDASHNQISPIGTIQSLEHTARSIADKPESLNDLIDAAKKKVAELEAESGKPFEKEDEFRRAETRIEELNKKLSVGKADTDEAGAAAESPEEAKADAAPVEEDDAEDSGEPAERYPVKRKSGEAGFLRLDWRSQKAKPVTKKIELSSKELEDRFAAAGTPTQKNWRDAALAAMERLHGLARQYPHLKESKYSSLIFRLNQHRKAREIAASKAIHDILQLVAPLDQNQYDLFIKKVVLDNHLENLERWERDGALKDGVSYEMAFGFTPETLRENHTLVSDAVEQDNLVRRAAEGRRAMWDSLLDEYLPAMQAAGVDMGDKFSRRAYFRQRVLEQMALDGKDDAIRSTGRRLRVPVGRRFTRQRTVGVREANEDHTAALDLDYSTNYVESEFEVMAQIVADTRTAALVAWIKDEDHELNILSQLKAQARARNIQTVMPIFESLAKQQSEKEGAKPITGDELFRQTLNSKQAMAISRLRAMAAEGELPEGDRGEWADLIEELRNAHLDADETGERSALDVPKLLRYAAWVLRETKKEEEAPARAAAGLLFKGIRDKKKTIERMAADKYLTWEDMIPEGYVAWQPREGHAFYLVKTIPEQLAEQIIEAAGNTVGVKAEDLRTAMARGSEFPSIVIPAEVARTLNELSPNRMNVLERASARILGLWKQWQLVSPPRVLKYNLRNLSGDGEITLVGNPKAFRRVPEAARLLYGFYKNNKLEGDLKDWFDRGGFQSNLQAQEVGDLQNISQLEPFVFHAGGAKQRTLNPLKWWYEKARIGTDFREGILRLANFLEYRDQMKQSESGRPDNWGASRAEDVMKLSDIDDRAFMLSNQLVGAYDEISTGGQFLRRHIFPFWSYQEVNMKRYWRLFRNAARDENLAGAVGKKFLGALAVRSPYLAYRFGSLLLKILAMWALLEAWNYLFFEEEEKTLRKDIRQRPHIILGKGGGKVFYFSRLGNLPDALEWIDPEDSWQSFRDWLDGRIPALKAAENAVIGGPIEKMASAAHPMFKLPAELAMGKSIYPDLRRPRTIHDRWEYLADHFSLGDEYRIAAGKPTPKHPIGRMAQNLALYESDTKQSAYYDTLDLQRKFEEKHGVPQDFGGTGNAKSEALRNMKLALRLEDVEAFKKYFAEYMASGGTAAGLDKSIQNMAPLARMKPKLKAEFIRSLGGEDLKRLDFAKQYYAETFKGPRLSEYLSAARSAK